MVLGMVLKYNLAGAYGGWGSIVVIGVAGSMECFLGGTLNGDVVWMPVTADGIECHHDLRLQQADVMHHLRRNLLNVLGSQRIRMCIVRGSRHARIAVIQKVNFFDPQCGCSTTQFVFPQFSHRVKAF